MAISKVKLPDNTTQDIKDSRIQGVDSTPTANSQNVVTSGGVKAYVDGALPAGDLIIPITATEDELTMETRFSTVITYTELCAAITAKKRIIASLTGAWVGDYTISYAWTEQDMYAIAVVNEGSNGSEYFTYLYLTGGSNDTISITLGGPDYEPVLNSGNLVTSGGVYTAIQTKYEKPASGIPASDLASGVIPTTLPASDVYAWAKAATKPSYTASEVGALPDTTVIPSIEALTTSEIDTIWSSAT